jgi:hypothetical protein
MWLWWAGNAILLVGVVPVVLLLANAIMRPAAEIVLYADDILEHGVGLTKNLEPVPALLETRREVAAVTASAVRYVTALEPLV